MFIAILLRLLACIGVKGDGGVRWSDASPFAIFHVALAGPLPEKGDHLGTPTSSSALFTLP